MATDLATLYIKVDSSGVISASKDLAGLEKASVNVERQTTSAVESMKRNWTDLAVKVAAAYVTIQKAMRYVEMGAQAQQAKESFGIVAKSVGENSDRIIAAMQKAAAGTVDASDIMQKAVKGLMLELTGENLVKIMEAARVSARIAGEDVKTAYEKITDAIATNIPRALRQYGLVTKEQIALINKALAAGVEEVNLYEIAMINAGLQVAKMSEMTSNAAESIQRTKAQMQAVSETIGSVLIAVLQKSFGAMQMLAAGALGAAGAFSKLMQTMGEMTEGDSFLSKLIFKTTVLGLILKENVIPNVEKWKKLSEDFGGAAAELAKKAEENLRGMTIIQNKAAVGDIKKAEDDLKAWEEKLKRITAEKELLEAAQKREEEWAKLREKNLNDYFISLAKYLDEREDLLLSAYQNEFEESKKYAEMAKEAKIKSEEDFILITYENLEAQTTAIQEAK
ncbi:MAG: hypothetical protein QMD11_07975, partial [Smithella sp.]|nr:hypothetical protein [Smithella sp.]